MDDEVITHDEPPHFADGTSLAVETCEGLVRLVTRDPDGGHVRCMMLAPSEAQQVGQNTLTAAFAAHRASPGS